MNGRRRSGHLPGDGTTDIGREAGTLAFHRDVARQPPNQKRRNPVMARKHLAPLRRELVRCLRQDHRGAGRLLRHLRLRRDQPCDGGRRGAARRGRRPRRGAARAGAAVDHARRAGMGLSAARRGDDGVRRCRCARASSRRTPPTRMAAWIGARIGLMAASGASPTFCESQLILPIVITAFVMPRIASNEPAIRIEWPAAAGLRIDDLCGRDRYPRLSFAVDILCPRNREC